jgi:hypothetical protein
MRFDLFGSNLADSLSDTPDVDQGGRWFYGVVLAALAAAWGIWCILDGEVTVARRGNVRELTGGAATAFGLVFVSIGAFMHFHFFWATHKSLWRFAELGKILSILLFLGPLVRILAG